LYEAFSKNAGLDQRKLRLDTIQDRDRQTDRQTTCDSKDALSI